MLVPHLLRYVELPHQNEQRWAKLKSLYSELEEIRTAKELPTVLERIFRIAGNVSQDLRSKEGLGTIGPCWPFEGVEIFLDEIASDEESETFFKTTLPFIITLASSIDEFAPNEGILLCPQQRDSGLVLERQFIASLLASAFLCALPPVPEQSRVRSINFVNFFSCFHREEIQSTQAAKFRCFLHYFERLHDKWPDIDGRVFFSRQVIPHAQLPTLDDWLSCDLPLCPVVVDHKNSIEDSGEHMLQVDFANRFIGGGVLGGGYVQEEIRFCINPELLVSIMFMEAMEDNEAIVIKGIERFSSYSGYGKTFEFSGDYNDESQRDLNSEFHTTVVAIDAKQFKNANKDAQYESTSLLRELNKALVGFYNPDVGSRLIKDPSDVESSVSSVESEELAVSPEEELNDDECEPLSQHLATEKLEEFSDNLVAMAMNQAWSVIKNDVIPEDCIDGDILTMVMKKSLSEVFADTPEKVRVYSETIVGSPSMLPKCMIRSISGANSPLVPSTPPSSPLVCDLERTLLHSNGFQASFVLNNAASLPVDSAADSLTIKSFADSLSSSLVSCVELTSSLVAAIATTTSSPVLVAAGTREVFEKSPQKIGSPVKNGGEIISFLSQRVYSVETDQIAKYSNGYSISEFAEDLSALVSSSKLERYAVYRDNTNSFYQPSNARKNLSTKFDQIKLEKPVAKQFKLADQLDASNGTNFEEFATKLASSVVDSAVTFCVSVHKGEKDENEDIDLMKLREEDETTGELDEETSDETDNIDPQSSTEAGDKEDVSDYAEKFVDNLVAGTISLAVVEAAELCANKMASGESSSLSDEEDVESVEGSSSDESSDQMETLENLASDEEIQGTKLQIQECSQENLGSDEEIQGTKLQIQECSESEDETISSSETSEDKRDVLNPVDEETAENAVNLDASCVPGVVVKTTDYLAQRILFEGIQEASRLIKKEEMGVVLEEHADEPEETLIELAETAPEEAPHCAIEVLMEEETLDDFAESFSHMTVSAAVEIAETFHQAGAGESPVRPVATGNWGCGVFRGDPELKGIIQWVVASAAECPAMVYHTFGDQRVSQLFKALRCLHSRDWKVSDVIQGVLRFCNATREEGDGTKDHDSLLGALCHTPQTSL